MTSVSIWQFAIGTGIATAQGLMQYVGEVLRRKGAAGNDVLVGTAIAAGPVVFLHGASEGLGWSTVGYWTVPLLASTLIVISESRKPTDK